MINTRLTRVGTLLALGAATAVGGCGEDDFENEPRPPVSLETSGVITEDRITISPDKFGAGPIVLTISNQTDESHTISLEGEGIPPEEVGPINPQDTATIDKTLPPGTFELEASSEEGVFSDIEPATITVGPERQSSSDDLLLP